MWPLAFPLALVLVLGAARAQAQPQASSDKARASLQWSLGPGAESCTDAPALERAVEARLRRDAFADHVPPELVVRGRADRDERGYVVRLQLLRADGEQLGARELTTPAAHCSALDDSLALVIALMVDVPPDSVELQRHEAVVDAGPSRISLPQRTHAPRQPWRVSTALLGVATFGFLPGVTPGLRVRAGVEPPYFWWTELDATVFGGAESADHDGGARFSLLSAGLSICPIGWSTERLRALACVGQSLGRLTAEGFGFDVNRNQTRLVYDIGVRGSLWWRLLPPFTLVLGVGVVHPLVRDSFVLSRRPGGPEELFQPSIVAFTGEAGVGLEFR
jgi:hypothetical protein